MKVQHSKDYAPYTPCRFNNRDCYGTLFLTTYITENASAQQTVAQLGYSGVLLMAIVSGFNTIAPVPSPDTFVPIFTNVGLIMLLIIIMLIIGTTIADLDGYFFGKWNKDFVTTYYPRIYNYIQKTTLLTIKHCSFCLFLVTQR